MQMSWGFHPRREGALQARMAGLNRREAIAQYSGDQEARAALLLPLASLHHATEMMKSRTTRAGAYLPEKKHLEESRPLHRPRLTHACCSSSP